ncbi:MAG: integrase arm-type DNA-binding domain-containing protein [Rhodoplanes sp.]
MHRPKPAEPHQHAHRKLNQAHSGKTGRFGAQSRQIDAGGKQNPLTGFAPSPTPSEDVIATAKDKTCLTATNIRSLKLPPGVTDKIFFDGDLPGFGLRIRASGAKTWMVQYAKGGRTRRMVLGPLEVLDPGKAREAAKDVLAKIRLGQDPVDDKRKARIKAGETFGVLLPKFLKHHASYTRARSHNIIKYYLTERVKLLNVFPVAEIDRRMISQCLSIVQETGPQARNNARRALSTFMTWAVKEGFIDSNPVLYTVVAKGNGKRERVLSDDELAQIWHALEQEPSKYHAFHDTRFRDIVRLLMLTGARRREISELEWEELNLKKAEITLPKVRTKNNREQIIPLSRQALAMSAACAFDWVILYGVELLCEGEVRTSRPRRERRAIKPKCAGQSEPMDQPKRQRRNTKRDVADAIVTRLGMPAGSSPSLLRDLLQTNWAEQCKLMNLEYFGPPGWDFAKTMLGRK